MVKWLVGLFALPVFYGVVWAVDMRIEQQMGYIVEDQMDRREIRYLENKKLHTDLTTQEERDLEYYKESLKVRAENQ